MEFTWIELLLGFAVAAAAEEDEMLALRTELGTASEEFAAEAAAAGLSATT